MCSYRDDYYNNEDFYAETSPKASKKQLTLAEEKEALKQRIKDIGNRKKKPPKYKREPKDILNDLKNPSLTSVADQEARKKRKMEGNYYLNDFNFISTLGTGTFGRVRLVKHRDEPESVPPMALKCLKKSEIIRLK